jgi:hypothetical protein
MNEVEREAIKLTAMLSAAEKWAPGYAATPQQHAQMLKAEAELQIVLTKFFRNMKGKVRDFVNWDQYNHQRQLNPEQLDRTKLDYNVDVIVNDEQIDQNDGQFIKVSFSSVNKIVQASWAAAEIRYAIPTDTHSTSAILQSLSTDQVAKLVGKKVLPDGSIVDNPDASYNVMDTVRKDIAQSIKTSLGLGETTDEAIARMEDIINEVDRAELIAQTESVAAWNASLMQYGSETEAVGKTWETAGAEDECADDEDQGPIPIDDEFGSGDSEPPAHPRCRCSLRLIYQQEWDDNGYGDNV